MKLSEIKKRLISASPFLVYNVFGNKNELAITVDGALIPLSVEVVPPTPAFIIESGQITSLIVKYSPTYRKHVKAVKEGNIPNLENSTDLSVEMMNEVREQIFKSEEEQAKMIAVISKLGREFFIHKAVRGWYGDKEEDKKDSFKLIFTPDKEAADHANIESAEQDDQMTIWVDLLTEMELLNAGMALMDAMPSDVVANIPIVDDVITPDGTIEKGVTASVPADKAAMFLRSTRGVAVEDVRK